MKKVGKKVNAKLPDMPKDTDKGMKKAAMKQPKGKRGKYIEEHYGGYGL